MSYSDEVLADGPSWYYTFDELTGAFLDTSGHSITCTITGTPTRGLTPAIADGGSAIAVGTSAYLTLGYTSPSSTAQTIEGWFRTSSTGTVVLMQNRGPSPGQNGKALQLAIGPTGFGAAAGQVTAYMNATSFYFGKHTTGTINDGNWHHVVATWAAAAAVTLAASQITIYVDGVAAATTNDTGAGSEASPAIGNGNMTLFANVDGPGRSAQVDADNMAFYNDNALSPTRIAIHYGLVDETTTPDPPPYEAPEPALAILEIYVNDPYGPNWDEALWDEDDWGSAGWVDVTPEGVTVDIQWGSTRPELGILTVPEAANWYITFYDPNRLLDPANAASPYQSDLRPGLPHRISHRGVVIKTGQADVIGHGYKDDDGLIRGSDIISLMARADVPDDLVLDSTLAGRARDVIAAAGLPIIVYTGDLGGDGPSLGAKLTGNKTVWDHIKDAAQAVLHFPYVTKDNHLGFRAYAAPVDRGRVIASPNLVDASSIVDTAGLVSEVFVQETAGDGGSIIDRAITPPPWFGRRVFERTEETPDAETWADMVLADRSLLTLRWVPGAVYPITADDVDYFAGMLPLELVGISIPEQSVSAPGVIVGGTIQVVGRKDQSADWRFEYEAAATSLTTGDAPLYADGGIPSDYLTTESGSEYLYPD